MNAYVIVEIEITDAAMYEHVKEQTPPIVAQYGGDYLARGGATHVAHGSWHPKRVVILRFPSLEQAQRWETSPEYTAVKEIRGKCARVNMVMVEGK